MAKRSQVKKKRSHRKVITRKAPGQNINISLVAPGSYPRSAGADDLGMVYERAIKEAIATANRVPVATEAVAVAENPVSDEDRLRAAIRQAAIRQSREEGLSSVDEVRAYSRSESYSRSVSPSRHSSRSNAAGGGPSLLSEQQAALEARRAAYARYPSATLGGRTSERLLTTLEVDA